MTFHRKERPEPTKPIDKFFDRAGTVVKGVTAVIAAVALLLHGIAFMEAQFRLRPRLTVVEAATQRHEAILGNLSFDVLDKRYVPRTELDDRKARRDKFEADLAQQFGRVEDRVDHIDNAITTLATRH